MNIREFFQRLKDSRANAESHDSVVSVRTVKWCWSFRIVLCGLMLTAANAGMFFGWRFPAWAVAAFSAVMLLATYTARRIIRR